MYKKILSAILFGAFTIASTSTFVSCKDYDEDIDNLTERLTANDEDNQALHKALKDATDELANLKQNLTDQVARIDNLLLAAKEANEENKKAIADEVIRATGVEAALREKIEKLEGEVVPELKALIQNLEDNKLDKKTYEDGVKDIYAKLEAVETDLGKALKRIETLEKGLADEEVARKALAEDLDQQKEIIKKHGERLDEVEKKATDLQADLKKLREDYEADVKRIDKAIEDLAARVKANEDDIETLKKAVQNLSEEIEKINSKINELNVLILKSLRSLVFIPDFYYWGIEATEFDVVNYAYFFALPEVSADKDDPTWKGDATDAFCYDHSGHIKKGGLCQGTDFFVENFVARYHMNPSSADLSKAEVHVLSADRNFRTKAAAVAVDKKDNNIVVASWDPAKDVDKGDLNLNLAVNNYTLLKKVGHIEEQNREGRHFVQDNDETLEVTTFAAEVTLDDAEKNTITSDYAALLVNVKDTGYRLLHTKKGDTSVKAGLVTGGGSYTGIVNKGGQFTDTPDPDPAHVSPDVCHRDGFDSNRVLFTDADETVFKAALPAGGAKVLDRQPLVAALGAAPSTTTAQDVVYYNGTLDLSTLVSVQAGDTEREGETLKKWLASNGFELKFELTGIHMAENGTSESAHAAIAEDGVTFRPQMPDFTGGNAEAGQRIGKQAAYGAPQDRTTIGRTPLVRVSLIDKNHENRILDYGYIRIVIIDEIVTEPVVVENRNIIEYNTGMSFDYSSNVCVGTNVNNTWPWKQTWASFENDIYNLYHISQVDFEAKYDSLLLNRPGFSTRYAHSAYENTLKQYLVKVSAAGDTTFVECEDDEYLGEIYIQNGEDIGAGTKTQILVWNITTQELKNYADDGKKETTRAILYNTVNGSEGGKYWPIFVVLKAGEVKKGDLTDDKPEITADWNKIKEYWYDQNTQKTSNTLKEAHLNTPSPEDWIPTWREGGTQPFEFLLSSDFDGNKIFPDNSWTKFIKITPATSAYKLADAQKTDLEFIVYTAAKGGYDANNKATGFSGATYTISVKKVDVDGVQRAWELWANTNGKVGNVQVQSAGDERIAYLEKDEYYDNVPDDQKINHIKIVLDKTTHRTNHTNSFIEDILNYVAHNELNDNAIKIYVGVGLKWVGSDQRTVCFEAQVPFQLRLLRPVNMIPEEPVQVQDAANTTQIIYLYDLVRFTDWREQWNPTATSTQNKQRRPAYYEPDGYKYIVDYWWYYSVKHILIGDGLSTIDPDQEAFLNDRMHTNLNGNDIEKTILEDVSNNVEFKYIPSRNGNAVIGDREYYGVIQYTNNRSTVDEFDVTVPITVCYVWGHQYIKDVKIKIVKTLENTEVKVVR